MSKKEKIYLASPVFLAIFLLFFFQIIGLGTTVGTSMLPTIKPNTHVIFLKQFYPENLTGYIIIFKFNSTFYVCHRVIADNSTHVLTKGDNNPVPDGWIKKDKVIGVIIWHE